ncbi:DEAD/DEAH box helicase [Synechococcus sp. EJ6-Ellesmere]|uniref:DEAD/DEAH box helicase n=1 Tax=Synechococcus sp. EJ6-Ellesmere TaxID=2823734 RepID=UPI0020CD653F|nr:DEAD/DEAH box helicase [Synechococcus sp. EJ6-Ellesmere]MCP9823906.1 DEAD/DEAH box helicase [Synechococcus sp. EJ6-Ellesmere]
MAGPAGFTLRPYQQALIEQACVALKAQRSPLIVLPTGGGKTALISDLVRLNRSTGRRSTVICHRREIALQLAAAIERHTGEVPEMVMAGSRPDWSAPVLVAMVPTLARRLDRLHPGGMLLADEAHHMGSSSWQKVREALAPELLAGFTATPIRPDGRGLGGAGFDVLLEGPSPRWLMDHGFLCPYELFAAPAQIDVQGIRTVRGDYDPQGLQQRVVGIAGDVVSTWLKLNKPRLPTICVGVTVEHAQELAAAFNWAGISAVAVDGKTPTAERDHAFSAFRAGQIKVLCCCALVDEGLDVPEAGCLQLVRPTKSLRLLRQLQGRVLRPSPGKERALLIDHGPSWSLLPMPCEEIAWSLDAGHQAQPKGTPSVVAQQEGGRIEIVARQDPTAVLRQIDPAEALQERAIKASVQLQQILCMYQRGRVPRGAVLAVVERAPRHLYELKRVARVLRLSWKWASREFRNQPAPPPGWPPLLREEPAAGGWDQALKVEV